MAWRSVGSATLTGTDERVRVGFVKVPPQNGVEVWIKQTTGARNFKLGACLLYMENEWGRELGTIKFWPKVAGEALRLGAGLSSMVGGGLLWVEPRNYNQRWILSTEAVGFEVFADEPSDLPRDRFRAPGFVDDADRGLSLIGVGSSGRVRF